MKTPRSDKAWKAYKHGGNAQHIRSESCRLEAELAAAKADMDDLFKRFREAIEQRQETQSANAFIDAQILDAIKAKLEKCRTAMIETMAECASLPNFVVKKLSETLEETK